jgi:uncharacterized protein (TIGR00645 family)
MNVPNGMLKDARSIRSGTPMKALELFIERIILASRWLLVVFYLGLAVALAVYAASFANKLLYFIGYGLTLDETETILRILALIDAALVASLVVMVIISGYENFVSRFEGEAARKFTGLARSMQAR